jgi:hypothetical protein
MLHKHWDIVLYERLNIDTGEWHHPTIITVIADTLSDAMVEAAIRVPIETKHSMRGFKGEDGHWRSAGYYLRETWDCQRPDCDSPKR